MSNKYKLMLSFKFVAFFALVAFFLIGTVEAASDKSSKPTVKIGVVNMDFVLQKSIAAKNLKAQIDKKRSEYQQVIKKREKSLRDFQQGVVKEKDKMKDEELTAKKKLFQQKLLSAQRDTQEEIKKIDMSIAASLQELRRKATKIVADIADEKGLEIVLSHQQVVIAEKEMDITQEVLKRLNKQVKNIPIKWGK